MSGGFNLDDYVDVAERIKLFYGLYPDGRIVTQRWGVEQVGDRLFAVCSALAYRTPDDPRPCSGTAWEPIPGPTPYTRDSELMNAETAAWGRAIIAVGIPSKKIASAQEVQARQAAAKPPAKDKLLSKAQLNNIHRLVGELADAAAPFPADKYADWDAFCKAYVKVEFGKDTRNDLTSIEARKVISWLEEHQRVWAAQVEAEAIPF